VVRPLVIVIGEVEIIREDIASKEIGSWMVDLLRQGLPSNIAKRIHPVHSSVCQQRRCNLLELVTIDVLVGWS